MGKSLKKNAMYSFIKNFMNFLFPLISFPYATRVLLPDTLGTVNFLNSIIDYFLLLAGLGIATYASREAARLRVDQTELNKFSKEIIIINSISTIIAYIIFFIALFLVPKFSKYRILLCILSSKIFFETIGFKWLFIAEEEYKYITIRSIFLQILSLIFLFIFVRKPEDYLRYALFGMISSTGANIFNLFYAPKFINIFEKTKIELRKHIKPIFIFFGSTFATTIYGIIDSTMIGFLDSETSVGYYAAANKLIALVISLTGVVISSFMPRSVLYFEKKMYKEYSELREKVIETALFFCIPAALGLFAICKPAVLLICGPQYINSINAMRILCPLVFMNAINSVIIQVVILPKKQEKMLLIGQFIQCLINISLNYFLIMNFKITGAAIATLISEIFIFLYLFLHEKNIFFTKSIRNALITVICSGTIMFVSILFINFNFNNLIIELFIKILMGAFIYGILTIILRNRIAYMIIQSIHDYIKKIFIK